MNHPTPQETTMPAPAPFARIEAVTVKPEGDTSKRKGRIYGRANFTSPDQNPTAWCDTDGDFRFEEHTIEELPTDRIVVLVPQFHDRTTTVRVLRKIADQFELEDDMHQIAKLQNLLNPEKPQNLEGGPA